MKTKLKVEEVLISKLKENKKNPKKHFDKGIKESIEDLGYLDPIEVDEKYEILAGHGRLQALKKLKYKKVPVIVHKSLTKKQKEQYLLSNNKLSERGGWDDEILKQYFDAEQMLKAGFEEFEVFDFDNVSDLEVANASEVITVEAPGAVRLKERSSFYFSNKSDYDRVKNFFSDKGGKLDVDKLLSLLK